MDNISVRQGETFEKNFESDDLTLETVTITVSNEDGVIISESASFSTVDDKRIATLTIPSVVADIGEYEYMYTFTYTDDFIQKYPDADDCEEGCTLPTFTICKALDMGVS